MKRLLIALMAVAMVLLAVSFAAAQGLAQSNASVTSFQAIIPPGTTSGLVNSPGITATFTTVYQTPINSNNPTATGSATGFGGYSGRAIGGGLQVAIAPGYGVGQASLSAVRISGSAF
jgi:hypothetical protein